MKIFIIGGHVTSDTQFNHLQIFEHTIKKFSENVQLAGHDILVCSPFKDSADYFAVLGAANVKVKASTSQIVPIIEFHYPNNPVIDDEVRKLISELKIPTTRVKLIGHLSPSDSDGKEAQQYSWLLAQINALDSSNVVFAIGGREEGTASLLLRIAESRRKPILPLRFLGGSAGRIYDRLQYQLSDKLGDSLPILNDPNRVDELTQLIEFLATSSANLKTKSEHLQFFISYPRSRPKEADYVESLLRRRNFVVYRDEEDFQPGTKTYEEIRENMYKSTVFIAIWCQEYACSPWCFDELDLALDRHNEGKQALWILNVDGTRMVPPRARDIAFMNGGNRAEIQASILHYINQIKR